MSRQFSALILIALCFIAATMAQPNLDRERDLDSIAATWNRRAVTQSQKEEVAKNQAYRDHLNDVNANVSVYMSINKVKLE